MSDSPLLQQLRALAALELELDLLVAEKVGEARRAGLSWDQVAEAAGVSRPSAWRRWSKVVDDARPTRPLRRDAHHLLLTPDQIQTGQHLIDVLAARLVNQQDSHPWSGAVRLALSRLSLRYEVHQRGVEETEYHVPEKRLQIKCYEPGSTGPGGLIAYTFPSPERGLRGHSQPATDEYTTDGALPASGEALLQEVTRFLQKQFEAGAKPPPNDQSRNPQ